MPVGMKKGDFIGFPVPDGNVFARITALNGAIEFTKDNHGAVRMTFKDPTAVVKSTLFGDVTDSAPPVLDAYAARWLARVLGSLAAPPGQPDTPPPTATRGNYP